MVFKMQTSCDLVEGSLWLTYSKSDQLLYELLCPLLAEGVICYVTNLLKSKSSAKFRMWACTQTFSAFKDLFSACILDLFISNSSTCFCSIRCTSPFSFSSASFLWWKLPKKSLLQVSFQLHHWTLVIPIGCLGFMSLSKIYWGGSSWWSYILHVIKSQEICSPCFN